MERNTTWKSPKIILTGLFSLILLVGLMLIANHVRTPVAFPDPNLERVIREKIEKRSGTIYKSDLMTVTELDASGNDIRRLEGIEALNRLVTLNLANNQVEDLTPLGNLMMLSVLDLSDNQIINLEAIKFGKINHLPLRELHINQDTHIDGGIEDLSLLSTLPKVEVLSLQNHRVNDLTAITTLTDLQILDLQGNHVTDCEPLRFLSNLRVLNLKGKTNSEDNRMEDISCLVDLVHLEDLNLRHNEVSDISHLATLTMLQVLDLRGNMIRNIDPIRGLTELSKLNLRDNQIVDIGPISNLANLTYLNIHSNPVEQGIEVIGNLTQLETLIMRNVFIGDEYSFVNELTQLNRLNIRNTFIADVSLIGDLMTDGALQDDPEADLVASINLLEIAPSDVEGDPYAKLRRYWDNVSHRFPLNLPYYPSPVKMPLPSHPSGFYSIPFYFELHSDELDVRIFYTLDGSEPSFSPDLDPLDGTIEYETPILIENQTKNQNVLANIHTSQDIVHYFPPDEIFKINVIRTIAIDGNGQRSQVKTLTFLIDENMDEKFSLPVVSITTNPDYFFDEKIGIYVAGHLYEPLNEDKPWWNPANYTQRGLKWERPINFQLFTSDGELIINQDAGIRTHGITSRWLPQKSLRLYARDSYSSDKFFYYNFFPDLDNRLVNKKIETFQTLILRNSGQDWASTLFRDSMLQSLLVDTRLDIQGSFPVILFLNGEYWGIHNIRTRYDDHYFKAYYGIPYDQISIIDGATLEVIRGETDANQQFLEIYELLGIDYQGTNQDFNIPSLDDSLYDQVIHKIDIDNTIDYFAAQFFINNTDWPWGNISLWRTEQSQNIVEEPNTYGHDGKWRWLVFDMDLGFVYPQGNTITRALYDIEGPIKYLFRALISNQTFREQFINRFADLLNTAFLDTVVIASINEYEERYFPEIEDQIHRWGNLGGTVEGRMNYIRWGSLGASLPHWQRDINDLREFAEARPTIIRQYLNDYFDLPGLANVTLKTNSSYGYIRINSIDVNDNTPGVITPDDWSGIYFQGVPIQISAVPYDDYQFDRWVSSSNVDVDLETASLILELNSDIQLTALFIKDE